jgi:hypothetical protein
LNSWIEHRGIPFNREDFDTVMEEFNIGSSKELTVLSYGLNLTDHYWLCEKNNEKNGKTLISSTIIFLKEPAKFFRKSRKNTGTLSTPTFQATAG